jgi:hypothetical protein
LGVVSSSRRYKEDIAPMEETSERLYALRPVTFRYKKADASGHKPVQYGLIAEEVANVFPELVSYNEQGQPETVAYQTLTPLLLNQLQREHRELLRERRDLQEARAQLGAQGEQLAELQTQLAQLRSLTERLAARTGGGQQAGQSPGHAP